MLVLCVGEKSAALDSKKHCLMMDEVDGMAGNEDRGGMQVRGQALFHVVLTHQNKRQYW